MKSLVNLYDFITYLNPKYNKPYHLKHLIKAFIDISIYDKQRFICFSVPPRHGKTETLLMGIAYYLAFNQDKTVGYISYSQSQAESKTIKVHNYLKQLGIPLNPKMQNRTEFRLAVGGGIITTGVQGTLTGQGLDLAIIDDSIKDREEADSKTIRNKVWGWFEDVLETRLEPNGSVINVMTRWHQDDTTGRIAKFRNEYEIYRIPALADGLSWDGKQRQDDLLGRDLNEALWSERFNREFFEKIKSDKAYTFSALYQGLPIPREDLVFKDATFYNELPNEYNIYIGADLAYTEKESGDYSACCVLAYSRETGLAYIIDVFRWQKEIDFAIEKLKEIQARYNSVISVEANGPQKGVYDYMKSKVRVIKAKVQGDKKSRSLEFQEAWNSGKVLIPKGKPWVNDYLEELQNFTGIKDAHDDQVDASNYAYKQIVRQDTFRVIN